MRVILTEQEILTAVEDFILDTVNVPDDIRVDIDLKATRGETGYTAEIDLVHMSSPADGSDRSVDDRIEAKAEAREEGLGIVEKIDQARSEAKAPRRRGRPAGSRNKTEAEAAAVSTERTPNAETQAAMTEIREGQATVAGSGTVEETITALNSEEPAEDQAIDAGAVEPADEPQPEPITDDNLTEATELMQEADAIINDEPAPEPAATGAPAPARSLFGNISETQTDNGPVEQAMTVTETEAPQEPEEEEVPDYTPTPETAGFTTEDAQAEPETIVETPAPKPTRSLFADLTKPKN